MVFCLCGSYLNPTLQAKLMDMMLLPRALLFVDWPLELCLKVDLQILPLKINAFWFWAIRLCPCFSEGLCFCKRHKHKLPGWSADTLAVSLLNTCPNVVFDDKRRNLAAEDSHLVPSLHRGATDSVRADGPPTLSAIAATIHSSAGGSSFLDVRLTVVSSSPAAGEFAVLWDPSPSSGIPYASMGVALAATVHSDSSGAPFDFRKIYYVFVRLTNKEGFVRLAISDPLFFPPPADLKLEHQLLLPPDSPGRALFTPAAYLPQLGSRPFAVYMNVNVKGGSFDFFESLVSLVNMGELVGVNEDSVFFADFSGVQGSRSVWRKDTRLIASPRFLSRNQGSFVVGLQKLGGTQFQLVADDLAAYCARFGAAQCVKALYPGCNAGVNNAGDANPQIGTATDGMAFQGADFVYHFNGSAWSCLSDASSLELGVNLSAGSEGFGGGLCCRAPIAAATDLAPELLSIPTKDWSRAQETCWRAAGKTLCSRQQALDGAPRQQGAAFWVREEGQFIAYDGNSGMTDLISAPPGVACCRNEFNSTWYSLDQLGDAKMAEVRAQTTVSLSACAKDRDQCYVSYLGGFFLSPTQGTRFSKASFGVDSTQPVPSVAAPIVISNAAASVPFSFGSDTLGNVNRYGGFSALRGDLPVCPADCSPDYGCAPCGQPFDSLTILNQTDVIEVTLVSSLPFLSA